VIFEPVDLDHLPNTSNIDGVPIYANPIRFVRRLFFKRLNLCLKFLKTRGGNILDAGCGSGITLPTLSGVNGLIVGLDLHNNLGRVHIYLEKNQFRHISLIRASTEHLPFRESVFQSILCISSLDHLKDPNKTIIELYRTINIKGSLIAGIRTTNLFYYILSSFFIAFYVLSYFVIFRNYREFLSANREMASWKHMYSDSKLIQIISTIFNLKKKMYLGPRWPAYVAIEGIKENK